MCQWAHLKFEWLITKNIIIIQLSLVQLHSFCQRTTYIVCTQVSISESVSWRIWPRSCNMQNHMACKGFCGLVPLDLFSIPASCLTLIQMLLAPPPLVLLAFLTIFPQLKASSFDSSFSSQVELWTASPSFKDQLISHMLCFLSPG